MQAIRQLRKDSSRSKTGNLTTARIIARNYYEYSPLNIHFRKFQKLFFRRLPSHHRLSRIRICDKVLQKSTRSLTLPGSSNLRYSSRSSSKGRSLIYQIVSTVSTFLIAAWKTERPRRRKKGQRFFDWPQGSAKQFPVRPNSSREKRRWNREDLALAESRSAVVGSGPRFPTDYDEACSAGNAITSAIADLYDSIQPKRSGQF